MFHILGFLFVIIVVILVIGLSIIGTVLRTIFGHDIHRKHKKLFSKDEGEYVDFEEIKE